MATSQDKNVLDTQTEGVQSTTANQRQLNYYHAGPLFTIADLHTNVLLSQEISRASGDKFLPLLPQDLEQRGNVTPQNIRDKDIRALLSCDLALFTYDGAELDSGTVVEFMIAKFADIPSVILRTDFRGGGDQKSEDSPGQPWNLMSSFWPRTSSVVVDAMLGYKQALAETASGSADVDGGLNRQAGSTLIERTAEKCVKAMNEAIQIPSRMPKELREHVYRWIALMPGYAEGEDDEDVRFMMDLLSKKDQNGVLY
ncbi:hypothetical protein PRZ48_006780 [Zasmidium cellare]|uniref:Nucleoside 2-deoxyribosyltransferase n=1 Tax=Zasmidium cellare TaxID=395010 RepID=A0ABR0EHI6_ZASCE|nr:hypothetical protein PRZ48_006780 [Zasmidium cellare]